jgi:geranylgeranyl diphosphate/geranylgeranyl-bacteriochlorophyllide a reductase
MTMHYDVVVVGGGPSGATAAWDLARAGKRVAFIDRAGRIKPCGGAIPPRLIKDFEIPDDQIVARINTARMISPMKRQVDIPIEGGFVGMVDREHFDEFLRVRAHKAGRAPLHRHLQADRARRRGHPCDLPRQGQRERTVAARDLRDRRGRRAVGRGAAGGAGRRQDPYVIAYHEIIKAPDRNAATARR